ncbi:hypothetical protein K7W42_19365 [Deinococcus sp. HMF7604]|uniref:hypothetical protein n=1 Tax=Deinococcus betulae TaxID=2873312 RepID=UPI001CC95DA1|nr:hypothetical protein [Deinococcus betulae]MBZ9753001.1 hypothetical protein [Deinococcus betulae]
MPADVPTLIPGAPIPEAAFLNLAAIWASGEATKRRADLDSLTGPAAEAARTAIAAKSLGFKAGLGGVLSLEESSSSGGLKGIKLPGLELTLNPSGTDVHGRATVAAEEWHAFAAQFLDLALPGVPRRRPVGVSR